MGYVPERITDYPQDIDDCPLHIDAEKLREAVEKYYEDPIGVKVALAIATFADSKGLAFPSVSRLSEMTGFTWQEVSKAVGRLQALGILTIQRRRFKNSQHSHNEYRFVKKFVRKVADLRSSHFLGNVLKWKAKAQDVATAVADHAVKAVNVVTDMAEKLSASAPVTEPVTEPASVEPVQEKPVQPVPAPAKPAMEKQPVEASKTPLAAQPLEDGEPFPEADTPVEWDYVSEENMAKMFRVFDAHPELVDDPVKAAEMAGVSFPDMKVSKPVSKPVEETTTPIQPVQTMKLETNLNTLPANTESVSAAGSNTASVSAVSSANTTPANTLSANTQPIQLDTANAPKFINGEVSSLWTSQQLLHKMNPDMYPAY